MLSTLNALAADLQNWFLIELALNGLEIDGQSADFINHLVLRVDPSESEYFILILKAVKENSAHVGMTTCTDASPLKTGSIENPCLVICNRILRFSLIFKERVVISSS